MKTGYFRRHARIPGAISISRSVPKFFTGPRYLALAPTWAMLKLQSREEYNRQYVDILKRHDPHSVYTELVALSLGEEPVLLCWEAPNQWCHRRLVAEWLEKFLGIEISEYGFVRQDVLSYSALWRLY